MAETGLLDVLSVVYAPNAVNTMFQRKAVKRANRGHFLVDAALNALLASMTFHVPLPHLQVEGEVKNEDDEDEDTAQASAASRILLPQSQVPADGQTGEERVPGLNDGVDLVPVSLQDVPQDTKSAVQSSLAESNSLSHDEVDTDFKEASELYDRLVAKQVSPKDLKDNETVVNISRKLQHQKMMNSRTRALWLQVQYIAMIDILKTFLKAERTGNWLLHLSAVHDMLPYLAAAGHNLYTKSARLYLQMMDKLQKTKPHIYDSFIKGHHVRRSDRF